VAPVTGRYGDLSERSAGLDCRDRGVGLLVRVDAFYDHSQGPLFDEPTTDGRTRRWTRLSGGFLTKLL
jgi:hypothetical protein